MEKRGEGIPGRDGKSEGTELCVPGTTRRVWLKYRRPVSSGLVEDWVQSGLIEYEYK